MASTGRCYIAVTPNQGHVDQLNTCIGLGAFIIGGMAAEEKAMIAERHDSTEMVRVDASNTFDYGVGKCHSAFISRKARDNNLLVTADDLCLSLIHI